MRKEPGSWALLISPSLSRKHIKRLWAGDKHFLPLKFHNPSSSESVVSPQQSLSAPRPEPAVLHLRQGWRAGEGRALGWVGGVGVQSPQFWYVLLLGDLGQPLSPSGLMCKMRTIMTPALVAWWVTLKWDRDAGYVLEVIKVSPLSDLLFYLNLRWPLQGTLAGR